MGRPQVTQHMRDEKGLEDKDHQQWGPGLKGAQRSGSGGKAETKDKDLIIACGYSKCSRSPGSFKERRTWWSELFFKKMICLGE